LDPAVFDRLRELTTRSHVAVLVGPDAEKAAKSIAAVTDVLSGTTLIRVDQDADVGDALALALRTGPAVLAIAGTGRFMSDLLAGLLDLKMADISVPPLILLSPKEDIAASAALKTAGKPGPLLETVVDHIRDGNLGDIVVDTPLLEVGAPNIKGHVGLILGVGAYAHGFKANFQGLYRDLDILRLHIFPKAGSQRVGVGDDGKPGDLSRLAPEGGGALTTYLYGVLLSTLPLPLLETKPIKAGQCIRYLATEQSRKARLAALRSLRGKLDRVQPYYGVHLGRASSLTMRIDGQASLDGADLELPQVFHVKQTPALGIIDLNALEGED